MSGYRERLVGFYQTNRALVWVSVVILVTQLGFGSVVPALPLYAQSFGVSQSAIGLAISIYGFARFLVNVPTGQLADLMGRRWALVLGEIATIVGNLLCGLAGSYELFLAARFLAGVGGAMVITTSQVILADISTRANRGRTMAVYQGAFLFAIGFGPVPGGFLAEYFGLSAPFFVYSAAGVIAGIVAFDKIPETKGIREKTEQYSSSAMATSHFSLYRQLQALFSQVGFLLVSFVTFVQFFARTGAIFGIVPLVAAAKMGATADQIGIIMAVPSALHLATVYFSGQLVDQFGRKPVIVPSTLVSGLSMISFALAPDYSWLLFSALLWGLAGGIGGPSPAAYAADVAPPGMNAITMGCYRTLADLGYTIGPVLLGWIADVASGEVSLWLTGGLFLVGGLLFGLFAPETGGKRNLAKRPATHPSS
ncbi:MAG: MFS transporter [Chloroflexota bacterium]